MSARPFQVRDHVRVTNQPGTEYERVLEGWIREIRPLTGRPDRAVLEIHAADGAYVIGGPYLAADHTVAFPDSFAIELIEAAVDPATHALSALLDWVNALDEMGSDPVAYRETCDLLADAARDYRESIGGAR